MPAKGLNLSSGAVLALFTVVGLVCLATIVSVLL